MIERYKTILCFPNFSLYKKKKKYEKFRGPFEHEVHPPPLNPPLYLSIYSIILENDWNSKFIYSKLERTNLTVR